MLVSVSVPIIRKQWVGYIFSIWISGLWGTVVTVGIETPVVGSKTKIAKKNRCRNICYNLIGPLESWYAMSVAFRRFPLASGPNQQPHSDPFRPYNSTVWRATRNSIFRGAGLSWMRWSNFSYRPEVNCLMSASAPIRRWTRRCWILPRSSRNLSTTITPRTTSKPPVLPTITSGFFCIVTWGILNYFELTAYC